MRTFLILIFLLITLEARQNPFFPSDGEKEILHTTGQTDIAPLFKQSSITLPSSARTIKKITIEYENLDASIDSRSTYLDKTIDWHIPLIISQTSSNNDEVQTKSKNQDYLHILDIKYAKLYTLNKSFKITTDDKMIRDFMLVNPHRIVLDFKRDAKLKSYIKKLSNTSFSKIKVGNHSGYYRIVLELDGQYKYKIQKLSHRYIIDIL